MVNQAAQRLGLPPAQTPTNFATATVARARRDAGRARRDRPGDGDAAATPVVAGAAAWARPWRGRPRRGAVAGARRRRRRAERSLAACTPRRTTRSPRPLAAALERAGLGGGVLVCLPPDCTEEHLAPALRGAQQALAGRRHPLRPGRSTAAARPAWPGPCTWRRRRAGHRRAPAGRRRLPRSSWVVTPRSPRRPRFSEVHYDDGGSGGCRRCAPCRYAPEPRRPPLGRGRRAAGHRRRQGHHRRVRPGAGHRQRRQAGACWAAPTRPRTASWPPTWRRMAAAGVTVRYARADVTDAGAGRARRSADAVRRPRAGHRGAARRRPQRARRAGRAWTRPRSGAPWPRRSTACGRCSTRSTRPGCGCW